MLKFSNPLTYTNSMKSCINALKNPILNQITKKIYNSSLIASQRPQNVKTSQNSMPNCLSKPLKCPLPAKSINLALNTPPLVTFYYFMNVSQMHKFYAKYTSSHDVSLLHEGQSSLVIVVVWSNHCSFV